MPAFIKKSASKAYVYYDNKLIKTIDLSIDGTREYNIEGYNGNITIETKKNKIRVKDEISPHHLCSKQGWVSSPLESIICLPNKVIIKIEATQKEVDAVIR
jgi:hypothetical protein